MSTAAGGRMGRNIGLNLLGLAAPVAAAVLAVPPVLAALGEQRFGILALAWAVISFAGVLDLGVARALTKLVAERLEDEEAPLETLIGTALSLALALGIAGAALLALIAPWLVEHTFSVPPQLLTEAVWSLRLLALGLPLIMVGTALRGVLEAHQRFDLVNAVRIPMGVILFVAPLLVIRYSDNLIPIVAILVAARGLALLAYLVMTRRCQRFHLIVKPDQVRTILELGGWMTVSNLIAPVLLYVDRFVVASVAGLAAVTYYATPFEIISRLSVAPLAVMGVLFPAMSSALVSGRAQARRLYSRSLVLIAALLLPPVLVVAFFARPILTAWLGSDFAAHSHLVASLLALGALAHGLAQPSFNLIQAAGRADLSARVHLIEMPLYVAYLWWLTARFGIAGTAAAWLVRVSASAIVLAVLARLTVLGGSAAQEES